MTESRALHVDDHERYEPIMPDTLKLARLAGMPIRSMAGSTPLAALCTNIL